MNWIVGVTYKNEKDDPLGRNMKNEMLDIEIPVEKVNTMQAYFIKAQASQEQIKKACEELFADSIIQEYQHTTEEDTIGFIKETDAWIIQVKNKPGVTDAVGESARKAMNMLGINTEEVHTATTYTIKGQLTEEQIKTISEKILANPLIQEYKYVRK